MIFCVQQIVMVLQHITFLALFQCLEEDVSQTNQKL